MSSSKPSRGRKILVVHQNYPGQFLHMGPALAQQGHEVKALRMFDQRLTGSLQGVEIVSWQPGRSTCTQAHPWVQDTETKFIRGEAAGRTAEALRQQGWHPELIVGHPGWGDMLFLEHIWPDVPQLHFLEFMYASRGLDVDFDPEFASRDWCSAARVQAKNGANLLSLQSMTAGLSPTRFQASTFPRWAHNRIHVIHDGIDTDRVKPDSSASWQAGPGSPVLRAGDPVVTFVNRNLEPYRGYHRMIRALPEIQKHHPTAMAVLVGGEDVSYGAKPSSGSWKKHFLKQAGDQLDLSRVIFPGRLAYASYLRLLQVSACHVYLTYPFVLGWSCVEALAAGCYVVGSATEPVQEVIEDGVNGRLVGFFDQDALVSAVLEGLKQAPETVKMRQQARASVLPRYDLKNVCLPQQLALVNSLLP